MLHNFLIAMDAMTDYCRYMYIVYPFHYCIFGFFSAHSAFTLLHIIRIVLVPLQLSIDPAYWNGTCWEWSFAWNSLSATFSLWLSITLSSVYSTWMYVCLLSDCIITPPLPVNYILTKSLSSTLSLSLSPRFNWNLATFLLPRINI